MINLTKKYRLIWDVSTLIIQNNYKRDYTGTITIINNNGEIDLIESDDSVDINNKIIEEDLQET